MSKKTNDPREPKAMPSVRPQKGGLHHRDADGTAFHVADRKKAEAKAKAKGAEAKTAPKADKGGK